MNTLPEKSKGENMENCDKAQNSQSLLHEHDRLLALPDSGYALRDWLARMSAEDLHTLAHALGARSLGLLNEKLTD